MHKLHFLSVSLAMEPLPTSTGTDAHVLGWNAGVNACEIMASLATGNYTNATIQVRLKVKITHKAMSVGKANIEIRRALALQIFAR